MGLRNWACCERSNSSGVSPSTVVAVVRKTGRSLSETPSTMAVIGSRSLSYSPIRAASTIESLRIIPVSPRNPMTENMVKGTPQWACPMIAPTIPNGMTDMITTGRHQLEKIHTRTA